MTIKQLFHDVYVEAMTRKNKFVMALGHASKGKF